MNKAITTGYQLKKILGLYLKGITDKDANIHKIQQLIYSANVQKLHAISIYQLVSHDPNNKLQGVIRLLDKKLMEYREYPNNSIKQSTGESFSLVLNVYRLKTLVKYNLPYEETVQILLENILLDNPTEADFDALFSLLEVQPVSYSKNYNKLIANILDLLQQYLSTNQPSPSFINTVVKYIYKSPYKISKALDNLINQSIDKSLRTFDMIQVLTLSNFMREKSLKQWIHLGMLDFSIIRKRIIFQYIMNKQFNGLQYRNYLPGKLWSDPNQLQQAIKCIRSIGSKQAFIDIFPVKQTEYTHPLEGYAILQKMQFANHYVQNLFHFIKNGCRQFDHYSFDRIIRTLRSFFTDSIQSPLSLQYFSNVVRRYSINVLTLAMVVYELSRYHIQEKEKLREITSGYLRVIHSFITPDYLKNVPYETYKYQQLTLLYNYIYCQTVDHFVKVLEKSANEESIAKFKKIEIFLSSHKDRKYTVSQFSKLSAFYRYVKAVSDSKDARFGGKEDILLQEQMIENQLKEIIEYYIDMFQIVNFSNDFPAFSNKYKIIKNILIQPNIQVRYAIIQKDSSKIICVFDYKEMIADRLAYDIIEQTLENGVVVIQEQSDLTLLGAWRKKFFNSYYQSRYLYCRTEAELALKLSKIIKELSQA